MNELSFVYCDFACIFQFQESEQKKQRKRYKKLIQFQERVVEIINIKVK